MVPFQGASYDAKATQWAPNNVWGQLAAGTAIDFRIPHYGSATLFRASPDESGGQSGGPVGSDYPGAGGPYVTGIPNYEHCFAGNLSCLTSNGNYYYTHPNHHRAMTPEVAS